MSVQALAHGAPPFRPGIRPIELIDGLIGSRGFARKGKKAESQRRSLAEQIGETAPFLVSDRAAQVSGQVIYVDNAYNIIG